MKKIYLGLLVACCLSAQSIPFPGPGGVAVAAFTPASLSGLQVWYAADFGSNCGGGACTNGASQTTWADQSGNANTASYAGGICSGGLVPPIYQTSQINGKPAVAFIRVTQSCLGLGTPVNLQTASTIFAVAKLTSTSGTSPIFSGNTNSYSMDLGRTTEQGAIKVNVALLGNGNATADTNWHQLNQTYDGTTVTFRIDRAADGTGSTGGAITANETTIGKDGGGDALLGQIAELIVYNRVLNGTEIGQVETYLNGRYAL